VRNRPVLLGFAVAAALLASTAARAAAPVPAQIPDLVGARHLALGAYLGIVAGNDGIFTNAASLAARRRYAIEGQWFLDRAGGVNSLQAYTLSVVDSETTSVTGGVAYTRVFSGPWLGNMYYVPVAFAASSSLFLGLTGKYLSLNDGPGDQIRAANADLSAFWRASRLVSVGLAGYNLIPAGHTQEMPRAVAAGVGIGDESRWHLAADWRGDLDRRDTLTSLFAAGAEYLVGDLVPARASFVYDETRNASFWSIGAGIVTSGGFAFDVSFRQRIEKPAEYTMAAAIKLFLSSH
jgi:hypothetical protein